MEADALEQNSSARTWLCARSPLLGDWNLLIFPEARSRCFQRSRLAQELAVVAAVSEMAIFVAGYHPESGQLFSARLAGGPRLACPGGKVGLMADTGNPKSFEEIVEWAYGTLPQKIRYLPDFPGIQIVDEPPAEVLEDISNREKWRHGTELLGLYSGTVRTKRSFTQVKYAPDLIFVFRGPILRCSEGDLRAEVKRVVWHEVAHWLGYETEEQVEALGL